MLLCTPHLILIHHSFPCSSIPLGALSVSLIHLQMDYNSSLLNISQSASLKLNEGGELTCSCGISSLVIIGKWSIEVGCIEGLILHVTMRSFRSSVQKMLSGLEYLYVTICCNVGMPFGRGMIRLYVAINSMRLSADLVACMVKRWVFSLLSHNGWC